MASIEVPISWSDRRPACSFVASIGGTEVQADTQVLTSKGAGLCLGRPLPGIDAAIIDFGGAGRHVETGEVGEICLKGAAVAPCESLLHQDERGLLLWCSTGSHYWLAYPFDGRRMVEVPLAEWVALPKRQIPAPARHGVLAWHPTGADYSIRWFFAADGTFTNWYANLERPAVAWREASVATCSGVKVSK